MITLFCPNGHSWFGEHTQAVCPECGEPVAGAMDTAGYRVVMNRLWSWIERSIALHGDWRDYGLLRIIWVIAGELWEVVWALLRRDIHGRHGVVSELRDLAVVCVKGIERLEKRGRE